MKIIRLSDLALKTFRTNNKKIVKVGGSKINKTVINLSNKLKNKKFENQIYIKVTKKPIFLIFHAKKVFKYLKQTFIKTLIL